MVAAGGYRYDITWDDTATGVATGTVMVGSREVLRTQASVRLGGWRGSSSRTSIPSYSTYSTDPFTVHIHLLVDEPAEVVFRVLPYGCVSIGCSSTAGPPIGGFRFDLYEDDFE